MSGGEDVISRDQSVDLTGVVQNKKPTLQHLVDGLENDECLRHPSSTIPSGIFDGFETASVEDLREMILQAKLQVCELEGDRELLWDEVHMLQSQNERCMNESDVNRSRLREFELKCFDLQGQIEKLEFERDHVIDNTGKMKVPEEIARLREAARQLANEKRAVERQLIDTKTDLTEAKSNARNLEALLDFYESQLQKENPRLLRPGMRNKTDIDEQGGNSPTKSGINTKAFLPPGKSSRRVQLPAVPPCQVLPVINRKQSVDRTVSKTVSKEAKKLLRELKRRAGHGKDLTRLSRDNPSLTPSSTVPTGKKSSKMTSEISDAPTISRNTSSYEPGENKWYGKMMRMMKASKKNDCVAKDSELDADGGLEDFDDDTPSKQDLAEKADKDISPKD